MLCPERSFLPVSPVGGLAAHIELLMATPAQRKRHIKAMEKLRRRAKALGVTAAALLREDRIVASIKKGKSRLAKRIKT